MFGVYLHIPFCAKKCSYCDFHFSTNFQGYRDQMIQALVHELGLRAPHWQDGPISTIYFGGGTPSLLLEHEFATLLNAVYAITPVSDEVEITLECNPDDCSNENLSAWKKLGINRLSIGVQSFNEQQLKWMNRTHNADEALAAINRAYAMGFQVLTCDVIYGLPGMSVKELEFQLKTLLDLGVNHLSAYCLTVEPKTALAKLVKTGSLTVPGMEDQAEQFLFLVAYLEKHGFEQYEISNFARNQAYSKHNTAYWQGKKYLAIGPSAHGYNGKIRYWNVANNTVYMKQIEAGILPEEHEVLTTHDVFNEALLIGLRTQWGVEKKVLTSLAVSLPEDWHKLLQEFITLNLVEETESHYRLTKTGRLQADRIASDLFVLADG